MKDSNRSLGFAVEELRFWGVITPQNLEIHHTNSK
jgi:hypothetical protein